MGVFALLVRRLRFFLAAVVPLLLLLLVLLPLLPLVLRLLLLLLLLLVPVPVFLLLLLLSLVLFLLLLAPFEPLDLLEARDFFDDLARDWPLLDPPRLVELVLLPLAFLLRTSSSDGLSSVCREGRGTKGGSRAESWEYRNQVSNALLLYSCGTLQLMEEDGDDGDV